MRQRAQVERFVFLDDGVARKALDGDFACAHAHRVRARAIAQQAHECLRVALKIIRLREQTAFVVRNDFCHATDSSRDHGRAAGHGLKRGQSKGLIRRCQREHIRR